MTDEQLQEIEAACKAATEGPWDVVQDGLWDHIYGIHRGQRYHVCQILDDEDDARLIASSRQWVPELVAEVRKLHGRIITLECEMELGVESDPWEQVEVDD